MIVSINTVECAQFISAIIDIAASGIMENIGLKRRDIRVLLLYEFRLKHTAKQATQNICQCMGENTVSYHTAVDWFRRFSNGNYDLEDKPHEGRPVEVDVDRLAQLIEEDPRRPTRQLEKELGCSHTTIDRHLKAMGKVYRHGQWVPHELTAGQRMMRVAVCTQLLTLHRTFAWLRDLVTGDEKWLLYVNHNNKRQWLSAGQRGVPTVKSKMTTQKVMLSVWWNMHGVIYWELLPQGTTINSERYCGMLDRVAENLKGKHGNVYLLHDNARPHTASMTCKKIKELGWISLAHPAYSPDISPTDYHLFRSLQAHINGKTFDDRDTLEQWLTEFFNSRESKFYENGITSLPQRWQEVIDNDGLYVQ